MKNIETKLAPLIESQFPGFYKEDGETFVAFVKAYYEWLDQSGSESRKLLEYRDVDYTVDSFLSHFKNEFLNSLPESTASSKRFLVKHIQDLYKSKGSVESYKLLFKLVFDENIEVYDPSVDILKPSDGIWTIPQYLECTLSDRAVEFLGQELTGVTSGAKAFVDKVVRKKINGRFIDVVYISDIRGQFITGEYITNNNDLAGAPYIVGSLNEVQITSGSAFNSVGDILTIAGPSGIGGKAKVKTIVNGTGKVAYSLIDGGYGYQNTSNIYVSNAIISVSNVVGTVYPFMSIVQPLQLYNYSNLAGNSFAVLNPVFGFDGSNNQVANGYLVSVTSNTLANTGNLVISVTGGNWAIANTVRLATNSSVNAVQVSTSNISATATLLDSNATSFGIYSNTRSFYENGYVKVFIGEPIGLCNISGTSTTSLIGTGNNKFESDISVGDTLYFRANGAIIGVVNSVVSNTSLTLVSNALFAVSNSTIWKTAYRATANVSKVYSSGSGTSFKIGSLDLTETVIIDSDFISANNSASVPFLDVLISGNNSGVVANGYGFAANTAVGYNDVIESALSTSNTITVGRIKALTSINPGNNYNVDPLVVIRENLIAGYDRPDLHISLANTNNLFSPGQVLVQDTILTRSVLTMSSNTGAFVQNEGLTQLTSGATGTLHSANSTTLVINVLSGTFVVSNNVVGSISGANAAISGITSTASQLKAKASIRSISNDVVLAKPITFNHDFINGSSVYSIDDNNVVQGLAQIVDISKNFNNSVMGFNANVNTAVTSANGIVTSVEIISSGYGYTNGTSLTLTNESNTEIEILGTAINFKQGLSEGFWKNNRSKLNSDKYIHDNKYYQDYAYEIRSKLSLNTYSDILKKLLHISGTELFGNTIIQSKKNISLHTSGVEITEGVYTPEDPGSVGMRFNNSINSQYIPLVNS